MDVLFKRGTSKALSNYVGTVGELTIGTDDYSVRLMTGETKGGIELARKDRSVYNIYTTMTDLGFANNQKVDLVDFFKALSNIQLGNISTIISFAWNYANSAYITDGTTEVRIASGILIIGNITSNFGNSWSNAIAIYVPNDQTGSAIYILSVTYKEDNQLNSKKIIKIGS